MRERLETVSCRARHVGTPHKGQPLLLMTVMWLIQNNAEKDLHHGSLESHRRMIGSIEISCRKQDFFS